jgi:hypothetical protein
MVACFLRCRRPTKGEFRLEINSDLRGKSPPETRGRASLTGFMVKVLISATARHPNLDALPSHQKQALEGQRWCERKLFPSA